MDITAPSHWTCIDLISDLHLQESDKLTFSAFQKYLQTTCANAVFVLGDLFEVWVGDDVLLNPDSFELRCAEVLRSASQRFDLFVMAGNRDFLMGKYLMQKINATYLSDPLVLTFANKRWLLSHGDAFCVDDINYMTFRRMVRSTEWQDNFLAKPLKQRQQIARDLRLQSQVQKYASDKWIDVDATSCCSTLLEHNCNTLIHGHTHRPQDHQLQDGYTRSVLSDWELGATPPRAEVLRLEKISAPPFASMQRLFPSDAAITTAQG
jgi:UDP-2,3-diacylglucosamine hydrolase